MAHPDAIPPAASNNGISIAMDVASNMDIGDEDLPADWDDLADIEINPPAPPPVHIDYHDAPVPAPVAVPPPHPGPDLANAVLNEDEPSYVYTPKGIYKMPHWYVDRDRNCPVLIASHMWRSMNYLHHKFTAAAFLNNTSIMAENIVVVSQTDPRNPHGRPWRCHWFVRLAVDGNSRHFQEPFGCNYLWQLPYEVCVEIIKEIECYAHMYKFLPHEVSPLARELKPTTQIFNPKDWEDVKRVESVPNYYDCLFAMATKPCKGPVPYRRENEIVLRKSLERHAIMRTCKNSPLKFEGEDGDSLPEDIADLIIGHAIDNWMPRSEHSYLSSLMTLRCLNKNFRDMVDNSATSFLRTAQLAVRAGIKAKTPMELMASRDVLMKFGMCPISLCIEAGAANTAGALLDIYSLIRLRSYKPPEEMPPKPAIIDPEQEAKETKETKKMEEYHERVLLGASGAFHRRRAKRRRIMAQARGEVPM